jgi:serine protease inhibitor
MMDHAVGLSSSAELTVRAMNAFAFSLHRVLSRDGDENLLCSPASVVWALAMVLAGARGQTKKDMVKALGIEYVDVPLGRALAEIDAATRKGAVELHLANAVWRQEGYAFKESFLKALADDLRAHVQLADFEDAAGATRRVNAWVKEETRGRIRDLLSPRHISRLARAILVNAVYFAGRWENEFDEDMTENRPFWVTPDRSIVVPTMRRTDLFRYVAGNKFEAVELPFRKETYEEVLEESNGITLRTAVAVPGGGSDFALCIILPERDGLGGESEFDVMRAAEIDWRVARWGQLDLHLPRFTLSSCYDLTRALRTMDFAAAFEQDADFSGATDDPDGLQIDQVIHQSFVRVDEKGAEAAAATAAVMLAGGIPEPPKEFKVDRPFLFMIRDARTGLIYFIGRVGNPISHSGGAAA